MDIFLELNKQGETIIMVTHEPEYGNLAGRLVVMEDGRISPPCCRVDILGNKLKNGRHIDE